MQLSQQRTKALRDKVATASATLSHMTLGWSSVIKALVIALRSYSAGLVLAT